MLGCETTYASVVNLGWTISWRFHSASLTLEYETTDVSVVDLGQNLFLRNSGILETPMLALFGAIRRTKEFFKLECFSQNVVFSLLPCNNGMSRDSCPHKRQCHCTRTMKQTEVTILVHGIACKTSHPRHFDCFPKSRTAVFF